VLWSRTALPSSVIQADDMGAMRYLSGHAAAAETVFINPRAPVCGAVMGHNWGHVSGLLPQRVWLDNEDMARKFGQGPMWDERWHEAQQAMAGSPADFATFLRQNDIRWVLAQEPRLAALAGSAGCQEVFRSGQTAVLHSP